MRAIETSQLYLIIISSLILVVPFCAFDKKSIVEDNTEQVGLQKFDSLKFKTYVDSHCIYTGQSQEINVKASIQRDKLEKLHKLQVANKKKLQNYLRIQSELRSKKVDSLTLNIDSTKSLHTLIVTDSIDVSDSIVASIEIELDKIEKEIIALNESLKKLKQDSVIQEGLIAKVDANIKNIFSTLKGELLVEICGVKYVIYSVNLDSFDINLHLFDDKNQNYFTLGTVEQHLVKHKKEPVMITNAGMYTPRYEPEGLYIDASTNTIFPLDTAVNIPNANFYLQPNGVFYIDTMNIPHIVVTQDYSKEMKLSDPKPRIATQSGPMLVINGELHPKFTKGSPNKKIRSGVGILNDKIVVFAATEDESNFYDFATSFKDLFNCKNALFLDGAISEMKVMKLGLRSSEIKYGPIISVTKKSE